MRIQKFILEVILLCAGHALLATDRRLLTVEDAVSTRRIFTNTINSEVALSPDGTRVAFIVKAPDPKRNSNNYELYVRDLSQANYPDNGRILFQADRLAGIQWLGSSNEIGVISTEGGNRFEDKLNLIDTSSGNRTVIESPTKRISGFSIDAEGRRIVFCAAAPKQANPAEEQLRTRYGFRVESGDPVIDPSQIRNWFPDSHLYLAERAGSGEYKVTRLRPLDSLGRKIELFKGEIGYPSLSPNGRFLVFQCQSAKIPDSWKSSFYGKESQSLAFPPPLWGLIDLKANSFEVAFDAPAYAYMRPVWSNDSRAFAVSALAPNGSLWEEQDLRDGLVHLAQMTSYLHLFAVNIETRVVSEVLHRYTGLRDGNISWLSADGPMQVPLDGQVLAQFKCSEEGWREVSRETLFVDPSVIFQSVASAGDVAIGLREDITTPPDLVIRDLKSGNMRVLTDLNPQYREITLGAVEKINWVNKFGVKCWGYLIMPVGYVKGEKYPLVIMNKSAEHFFVSDGSYTTAFPPQSLASYGIAVLMVEYYWDLKDLPNSFPGGLAEAYNWMAMVESGADYLISQGIVDKAKVGLIGFSRTSWKTDFMLTHSDFRFAAASSADGGLYNYGVYWLLNQRGLMAHADEMMGGPPYGQTLENWLKYAPAFNAQHVKCPILMEYSGYGHSPFGPLIAYEFFTALHRQNKPVELFFYPLGDHPLDTPSERVASLQRNVDWFRFWMQGYEGPAPDYDRDQYVRWRELRKKWEQNQK